MLFDLDYVRNCLPEHEVIYLPSVDTTMRVAAEAAARGAPAGTIVVADEQTAGRGRLGRSWYSAPGVGLYFSILVWPKSAAEVFPALTLACGLAVHDAISTECKLEPDLRWPNDVLIRERKVAGVLTQLEDGLAIVGIGINVNHKSFPAELQGLATSLYLETGREWPREALLVRCVEQLKSYQKILEQSDKQEIFRLFEQRSSYAWGKRVVVEMPGKVIRGITEGLNSEGFLQLRSEDGVLHTVIAGGVRSE